MASGSTVFEFGSNGLIKAVRGLGGHRIIFGAGGRLMQGLRFKALGKRCQRPGDHLRARVVRGSCRKKSKMFPGGLPLEMPRSARCNIWASGLKYHTIA